MTDRLAQLLFIGWNIRQGNDLYSVKSALDHWRNRVGPDLIALNEANRRRGQLGMNGYLGYWPDDDFEDRGNPQFARRDTMHVVSTRTVNLRQWWQFRTRRRAPRSYTVVRWRHESGVVGMTVNAHFPTGGPWGRNGAAWREQARSIVTLLNARPYACATVLGDFNAKPKQVRRYVANPAGAQFHYGSRVDHLITRGTPGLRVELDKRDVLALNGSDHHPNAWHLSVVPRIKGR